MEPAITYDGGIVPALRDITTVSFSHIANRFGYAYQDSTNNLSWPPSSRTGAFVTSAWVWAGELLNYQEIDQALMNWDTSSIPDDVYIARARVHLDARQLDNVDNAFGFNGEWYSAGTSLGAEDVKRFHDPGGRLAFDTIPMNRVVPGQVFTIELQNPNGFINRQGQTGLRMFPTPGRPAALAKGRWKHSYNGIRFDNATLEVTYGDLFSWPKTGWFESKWYQNQTRTGTPALIRPQHAPIDYTWAPGEAPVAGWSSENFSAEFNGWWWFPAGYYLFTACVDDAHTLTIDDRVEVFRPYYAVPICDNKIIYLKRGYHEINYTFFEGTGAATALLSWSKIG